MARAIADDLGWPIFEKDALKETLFDALGTGDGRSVVLEGNLTPGPTEPRLAELPPFRPVRVHVDAHPRVLEERFAERDRHPGHDDVRALADVVEDEREGRYAPLELDGPLLEIDTTSVGDDDVRDLLAAVRRAVG